MARRSRYLRYAEAVSMMREQDDETQKAAGKPGYHSSVLKRLKELKNAGCAGDFGGADCGNGRHE